MLASATQQCESVISIYLSPPSWISPHPIRGVREHRIKLPVWYSNFPLAIFLTYGNVYISMLLSQFVPPSPSPVMSKVCSLCLHLYSYPINRLIITNFLDSTHVLIYSICFFDVLCITGSRFIHLTRTDTNAFLFVAEQYSTVYMYHNSFIHSSVDGHLGCFKHLLS